MGTRSTDPYVTHDPVSTARFAGLVWLVYGLGILGSLPVVAGGHPLALVAGIVIGVPAATAGFAFVRGRYPSGYTAYLVMSYAGVAALALLQWLEGGARGELLTELYLAIALQTGSLHPLRRTAPVLIAIVGAVALQEGEAGWSALHVGDLFMHGVLWLFVALIANTLVKQLREQRMAARSEEAAAQHLARTDPLTGLGNRRRLLDDLDAALASGEPVLLTLFDLDGFKAYNDSFGHPAGDSLLHKLGHDLSQAVEGRGGAYRMGGDEFCVLTKIDGGENGTVRAAVEALSDQGGGFTIGASYGSVRLPEEASTSEAALRDADRRMYAHKATGRTSAGRQSTDVLLSVLRERHPELGEHVDGVTELCAEIAAHFDLANDEHTALLQAAALHDVGKAAIPDAILGKPGPLDDDEWSFMRQHTVMGERIMAAAPALTRAAQLVRWSHERMDGTGYPDNLEGEAIPLGSRIIAAADAFDAMVSNRPYRSAMNFDEAIAELRRCAGSQFDADVVEVLCRVVTEKPVPTPVA
jgi:diguanylate cyclase (GGDEF)-like protein